MDLYTYEVDITFIDLHKTTRVVAGISVNKTGGNLIPATRKHFRVNYSQDDSKQVSNRFKQKANELKKLKYI